MSHFCPDDVPFLPGCLIVHSLTFYCIHFRYIAFHSIIDAFQNAVHSFALYPHSPVCAFWCIPILHDAFWCILFCMHAGAFCCVCILLHTVILVHSTTFRCIHFHSLTCTCEICQEVLAIVRAVKYVKKCLLLLGFLQSLGAKTGLLHPPPTLFLHL